MRREPFHTDSRIWTFATAGVFVALGFVDPLAGAMWKGENSLWAHVGILVRGDYICSTADILAPIVVRSLFQLAAAAALGWVIQAFVVVLWSVFRREPPERAGIASHQVGTAQPRPEQSSHAIQARTNHFC